MNTDRCAAALLAAALTLTLATRPAAADDGPAWSSVAPDSATAASGAAAAAAPGAQVNEPWTTTRTLVKLDRADDNVVRLGPGESFAIMMVAPRNAEYPVITKRDAWYDVRISESRTGWIHESLCHERYDLSGLEFRPNPKMFSRIGSFTLTGWTGGYSFDRKSNSIALGGRVGYYLLDWLEFEGGLAWTHVDRPAEIVEDLFALRLEPEVFHMIWYDMNANAELLPGRQLVPYVTGGVGSTIFRGDTESSWNVGGGIHFFVAKKTSMRWEFRNYRFDSGTAPARRTNNNFVFTIGTTVLL
ncbi:MAG: outer membrane beta-barrel protein [bacterium]